jgi:hypothetical protein
MERASGRVTTRSVDLNPRFATDRDAKARELALAIAEVVRRAELEGDPLTHPALAPAPPRVTPSPGPPEGPPNATEPRPWRADLGVAGTAARWTGGEVLFGVDATGRLRLGTWLITDLRLGGRKTRPVQLQTGKVDAQGMSAMVGLSLDIAPFLSGAGAAVGARLGADWLRYSAVDQQGLQYGGGDAGSFSASAGATAFVEVSAPLCITADAAIGTALHTIAITDNGRSVSGMRGMLLTGSLGLSAQF